MKFAIIEHGIVANIALADVPLGENWIQSDTARVGDMFDGKVFTTPIPMEALQPKPSRFISVPGFFDRFGTLKWPILTSADAAVKALVMDCSVRIKTGINLDTKDVSNGVALLQAKGFAVDRAAIIDAPIKESEKP